MPAPVPVGTGSDDQGDKEATCRIKVVFVKVLMRGSGLPTASTDGNPLVDVVGIITALLYISHQYRARSLIFWWFS